ncbi:MAG TPA: ABC transporter permease [Acidimicrobiales bacterium]|nr:ABC transporter permease [Acidimicrobiales bacterium]
MSRVLPPEVPSSEIEDPSDPVGPDEGRSPIEEGGLGLLTTGTTGAGRRRRRRVAVWLAVGWLALVIGTALLADLLPLEPYDRIVRSLPPRSPIGLRLDEPLGTDGFGRSMASRLVYGARQSLLIAVVAASLAGAIGTVIGVVTGYMRGKVDETVGVLLDALLAFPALVLLMAIASIGRRDVTTVIVALSVLGVPGFARVARARTLALAEREFVMTARSMGATTWRIMFREILPNLMPVLLSVMLLVLAAFIVAEGTLSFVGLGVPPPQPSWGGMINEGRQSLRVAPQLIFTPAVCLVLTVMSFRVVGEWLGDRLDAGEGGR